MLLSDPFDFEIDNSKKKNGKIEFHILKLNIPPVLASPKIVTDHVELIKMMES